MSDIPTYKDLLDQLKRMELEMIEEEVLKENEQLQPAAAVNDKKQDTDGGEACAMETSSDEERDPLGIFEPPGVKITESEEEEIEYYMSRLTTSDVEDDSPRYEVRRYTSARGSGDFTFKVFIDKHREFDRPYDPNRQILPPNVTIIGNKMYRRERGCCNWFFSCFKCLPCVKDRDRDNASECRNPEHV
ncbi:uncharacterized protein LOC111046561 [Nilaparvata lugens]|uniref:uncharacterized protein LOC111046561 n=1 Tax=Nilaparvata lugens TaxID=108931 RepID=UPI00193C9070|nr:uncharacterized protein LOC111046561 [Nilaparvata lugens]